MPRIPKVPLTPGRINVIVQRGSKHDARDVIAERIRSLFDEHQRAGVNPDVEVFIEGIKQGVRQAFSTIRSEAAEG